MTEELKDCPFCGCKATFVKHSAGMPGTMGHDRWDAVACKHCRATVGACDRRFREKDDAAAAWNRRAPDARDARIAELEAELAALKGPAPTPSNSGELEPAAVCGCGDKYPAGSWDAGFIAALGHCANCAAALDPVTPEPAPSPPWYPDDSGEWVEVPQDLMEMPAIFAGDEVVEVVTQGERDLKRVIVVQRRINGWDWFRHPGAPERIVAYKVVKP